MTPTRSATSWATSCCRWCSTRSWSADEGHWDIDDVAQGLVDKLIHRHPHVFGEVEVSGADEVLVNWEKLKAEETGGRKGVDEDIPVSLPALARAAKVQRRAAGWGFEWGSIDPPCTSFREEVRRAERGRERLAGRTRRRRSATSCSHGVGGHASSGSTPRPPCVGAVRTFAGRYGMALRACRGAGIDVETRARGSAPRPLREARSAR